MLENIEIQALITAIGTGVAEEFDLEGLRYHRIVLMADADVDGAHIRTLLLTFFFRNMRELIDAGTSTRAAAAVPGEGKRRSATSTPSVIGHVARGAEANGRKLEPAAVQGPGRDGRRPSLWDTTMDPEHRTLLQVTLEDAAAADRLFTVLMGEDVPSRRAFIEENAKYVQNLDV